MRILPFLTCFKPKACREDGAAKKEEATKSKISKPCSTFTAEPLQHQDASTSCDFSSVESPVHTGMPRTTVQAAFAFSWAVVDSDGHQVLDHHLGHQETAAAQILHQALDAAGRASNPHPDSALGLRAQDCAVPVSEGASSSSSSSFLLTLLGPQLEPVALETAQMGRPWKGTIYAQLPATGRTYDCSAHGGSHFTPAKPAAEEENTRGKEATACRDTEGDSGHISGRPARKAHGKSSIPWSLPNEPDSVYLDSQLQPGSDGISDHVPSKNNMRPSADVGQSLRPSVDLGLNAQEDDRRVMMRRSESLTHSSCPRGQQSSQLQMTGRGSRTGKKSLQM
ncbi:hypothetical protein DUNSADRAFT_12714 [Dunaliella salina]|uniref:Encoded protein n=1 Tax=Dunaliella salina TaxID=3046 RepID=A0ABQ7GAR0_DUNSA|nr:hypothetical protein DUNSADRAFT_12714 [Dunaliella salina]|eukprot:KAF5831692.1 hypothetical protein DUNSADRAFT_12714 [Dunaliella salina]